MTEEIRLTLPKAEAEHVFTSAPIESLGDGVTLRIQYKCKPLSVGDQLRTARSLGITDMATLGDDMPTAYVYQVELAKLALTGIQSVQTTDGKAVPINGEPSVMLTMMVETIPGFAVDVSMRAIEGGNTLELQRGNLQAVPG